MLGHNIEQRLESPCTDGMTASTAQLQSGCASSLHEVRERLHEEPEIK